jgi:hypothetical protein
MKWLKRLLNRLFPIRTHCGCGAKLDDGDRCGVCQDCRAW